MVNYDVIIIGAGAAGLKAAYAASKNNHKIAIIEMKSLPARKVAVSGGGHCNITNAGVAYNKYFGQNPNFVRSVLSRYSPTDVLHWATEHKIEIIEKTPGQYFCKNSANDVVKALIQDVKNIPIFYNTIVSDIDKQNDIFYIKTNSDVFCAKSVIIASGGTSFATLGVSDIGYKIAKKFGHKIVPVRPALCALNITNAIPELAGISTVAEITIGKNKITDSLLFTHMGIGGPLAYRASIYDFADGIHINLLPKYNIYEICKSAKQKCGRKKMHTLLSEYLPNKLAKFLCDGDTRNIADIKDSEIKNIANKINNIFIPATNISRYSMASAEVVRGGVATDEISSKTLESRLCSGLFFIGEVLDITGDLGGFNLHWAWASGHVAGESI